ncbi:11773_t:CDS:2, partial [Cetraspora pellucida]
MRFFLITLSILLLLATQGGQSAILPTLSPTSTQSINLETTNTELSLPEPTNLDDNITNLVDGCAIIHNKFKAANISGQDLSFPVSDVRSCYNSFKFDDNIRTGTIDTIKKILNGFYVFIDQVNKPPEPGFNFDPFDILKELDSLAKKKYNDDFEFTTDVINLLIKMKDPHTFYFPICYTRFTFTQQLALYSIVADDGSQLIKVFKDNLDSSNKNCVVDTINGNPALDVIKQFARDNVFVSKDLGVRFNMALTSLASFKGNLQLHPRSSQFNIRLVLPDKDSITYTLKCGSETKTVIREWLAFINNGDDLDSFSDSSSYWSKFCVNPSAPTPSQSTQPPKSTQLLKKSTKPPKSLQLPGQDVVFSDATLVADAKLARFYKLNSKNNIGVAMISTEDPTDLFTSNYDVFTSLTNGFKSLADTGVTKLILDLSNNEGGSTTIAHFINKILFPATYPAFPTDWSLTDIKKAAIEAVDVKNPPFSLFDRDLYLSSPDALPFNSTDEFLKVKGFGFENDKDQINGFIDKNPISLPWNATDMAILTNGYCGSACSSIALHLAELNDVTTVSVGGFQKTPLSISSFAGGEEFIFTDPNNGFEDLVKDLNRLGLSDNKQTPQ